MNWEGIGFQLIYNSLFGSSMIALLLFYYWPASQPATDKRAERQEIRNRILFLHPRITVPVLWHAKRRSRSERKAKLSTATAAELQPHPQGRNAIKIKV